MDLLRIGIPSRLCEVEEMSRRITILPKSDAQTPFNSRELARAWQGTLGRLELELNPHNFATWLAPTRARSFDGDELVIEAKSAMACDWLDRRMRVVIERAASQGFGGSVRLKFVAAGDAVDLKQMLVDEPVPAAPATRAVMGTVNCAYTFEDYLSTSGNQLALQACLALVEPSDRTGWSCRPQRCRQTKERRQRNPYRTARRSSLCRTADRACCCRRRRSCAASYRRAVPCMGSVV
jgi:hypothetical protein